MERNQGTLAPLANIEIGISQENNQEALGLNTFTFYFNRCYLPDNLYGLYSLLNFHDETNLTVTKYLSRAFFSKYLSYFKTYK